LIIEAIIEIEQIKIDFYKHLGKISRPDPNRRVGIQDACKKIVEGCS
jgi:hypothetical protein